ncbi:hypothetical protein HK102_000079, partial [Quaeritorhiza haematococci]
MSAQVRVAPASSTASKKASTAGTSSTASADRGCNRVIYTYYHDPASEQSKSVLAYLNQELGSDQLVVLTELPSAKDVKTIVHLLDGDEKLELCRSSKFSEAETKDICQKGNVDLLVKLITKDIAKTFTRPVITCPLSGVCAIGVTLDKVKGIVNKNGW